MTEVNPYSKEHQLRKFTGKKSKLKQTIGHIKPGKKTKEWNNARIDLKKEFTAMGIIACELKFQPVCWGNNALSFAHLDKRRYLTKEDLKKAVLACIPCHDVVEKMSREEMRKLLQNIIDDRHGKN